jgi:hypothetical protein
MPAGLIVSGRVTGGVFKVERTWRLESQKGLCNPQLVARAQAFTATDGTFTEYATEALAERGPSSDGNPNRWLVRIAETDKVATFASGTNDLWAQRFEVDKLTCALTVTEEH